MVRPTFEFYKLTGMPTVKLPLLEIQWNESPINFSTFQRVVSLTIQIQQPSSENTIERASECFVNRGHHDSRCRFCRFAVLVVSNSVGNRFINWLETFGSLVEDLQDSSGVLISLTGLFQVLNSKPKSIDKWKRFAALKT